MIQPISPISQHNNNNVSSKSDTHLKAGVGAVVGTVLPWLYIAKKQKTYNPFKMTYKMKDMLVLSASSVISGGLVSMIGTSKEEKKQKMREGIFQISNALLPTLTIGAGIKACEKFKKLNNVATKFVATAVGLVTGMFLASELSNKITDPDDEVPDRELSIQDCVSNADDVVGALTMARFPVIKNINMDKFLPVIYTYSGYRTGTNENDNNS